MNWFKNLKLVTKTALAGVLILVVMIISSGVYLLNIKTENVQLKEFKDTHTAFAASLAELHIQGLQNEQAIRNIVLAPGDSVAVDNYTTSLTNFDTIYKKTADIAYSPELSKSLELLRTEWDSGVSIKTKAVGLTQQGDATAAAELLVQEELPRWREFKESLIKLRERADKDLQAHFAEMEQSRMRTFTTTLAFNLAACITFILCMTLLAINLRRRLARFSEYLREFVECNGDLTTRMDASTTDELGEMAGYFNKTWQKLDVMIAKIVEHSTLVATYSGQLILESYKINRNSQQITGQSTAVATAGEEMSATSHDIARNCSMAADNSQTASAVATNGQGVVQKTIDRMNILKAEMVTSSHLIERLGSSSERIGAIANTIQDIADQTNLLALNAAIEAARAGEQGRGFAVVADEVRALAERTTRATREIAEMIKGIQGETVQAVNAMQRSADVVAAGVSEANESGTALEQIMDQINEVSMQVSQIATAAEEQSATTMEISGNISKISESADSFDLTVVAVNKKIRQLMELSEGLKKSTEVFKTDVSPLLMLDTAKYDHVMFVNRIERCLDGHEAVQAGTLPDHTTCRFGKWYLGEGKQLCNQSPSFKTINEPHAQIHRIAAEVVDLYNRGEKALAEEKLCQVEDMSHEIVELLDAVKAECGTYAVHGGI